MFLRFQICSSIFNSKYQSLERSPIDFAVFGFMSELNKYYTRDRPQISARWTHFLCLTNVSIFFQNSKISSKVCSLSLKSTNVFMLSCREFLLVILRVGIFLFVNNFNKKLIFGQFFVILQVVWNPN
jgi:hypothetical protein